MMRFFVKDLINVGVFTVLYMLVVVICGQLGALLPITQVFGPLYIPLVAGIPFMLFLTRVKHFGMVTAMGVLVGLIILATGQAFWVLLFSVFLAPAADGIMAAGRYASWTHSVLGYIVFSLPMIGTVVPLFFARAATLADVATRHDRTWVDAITAYTPTWMFAVMIAMIVIGAMLGSWLGRALMKKHFERAGIA